MDQAPEMDPRFVQARLGEDEIGVVVRAHIFVEANINQYLELVVSAPEYMRGLGLRYHQRVLLACTLGFDGKFKDALVALGEIRNNFSHKIDTQLTAQVVDSLYEKLPPFGKAAVQESYKQLRTQFADTGGQSFESLSPRDRFVLIALNLERLVMAAVMMVRTAQKHAI